MVGLSKILILSLISALLSTSTKDIERSFLQNNPKMLYPLLSSSTQLTLSFPEPIAFSDQLSSEQAYFLLKKIFSTYTTFEFYSESTLPLLYRKASFIFRARWSFINKKNDNQYVFHIFFYLKNEHSERDREAFPPGRRKNAKAADVWKITEIRAERF